MRFLPSTKQNNYQVISFFNCWSEMGSLRRTGRLLGYGVRSSTRRGLSTEVGRTFNSINLFSAVNQALHTALETDPRFRCLLSFFFFLIWDLFNFELGFCDFGFFGLPSVLTYLGKMLALGVFSVALLD